MADRDSAFLWETEALRSAGTRPSFSRGSSNPGAILEASDWLTLREASEITGVPTDTIRKWARHENVPSFLEKTEDGHLRLVSLSGMRRWAAEIGRDLKANELPVGTSAPDVEVDLTSHEVAEEPSHEPAVPDGSMLVPLDAWNKMLNQLGNLHEAGQRLAEARERAAKAETEARFLKERLAELRVELEKTKDAAASLDAARKDDETVSSPDDDTSRPTAATTLGGTAAALARKLYQGWRERKSS